MDVFHAIAEPNRRKMLELLADGEQSVQSLANNFDVTIGAVSQHLKILLDTQLVLKRKQGRYCYYRARPETLKEVHDWTKQYRKFWESRLDRLEIYLGKNSQDENS